MKNVQELAVIELNRLKEELGTWSAVGVLVSRKAGGSPDSWMVITNSVSNGKRKANHKLLVALGLATSRRRFSCDIPAWMGEGEAEEFRRMMRDEAEDIAKVIKVFGAP